MTDVNRALVNFVWRGPICLGVIQETRMLDATNVAQFGKELMEFANDDEVRHVLLDFNEVHYLSSAVLTELLRLNDILKTRKGSLRLFGLAMTLQEIFTITNLDKVIMIYDVDQEDEAVKRFNRSLAVTEEERVWGQFLEES